MASKQEIRFYAWGNGDFAQTSFKLIWWCHQLLFGFLTEGHLPRVFVMLVANDKGDNEMIPGAVHRSPDICLTAEENHIQMMKSRDSN